MEDKEIVNKRIARNTFLLYVRMILLMFIGLYTSRVVLKTLGVSDYGIYNLVGGFVAMIAYMNTVFVASTQRFLSFSLGENDENNLVRVFCSSLTVHLILAFAIVVIAETVGLWIVNTQLVIDPSRMYAANWVFQCSIMSLLFTIFGIPFNACVVAHEHMGVYAYISIFDAISKLLIAYALWYIQIDKLILYALLLVVVSFVDVLLIWTYCKKKFPECKFSLIWDKKIISKMSSYAGWTAVGTMGFTFKDQALNIILNLFFGTVVNAARGISIQVNGIVNQFATNFFMAVSPQITKQYASGNIDGSCKLVYSSAKFAFFLLAIIVVPIIINIDFILRVWLDVVPEYTSQFLQIVLIGTLIGSLSTSTTTAIQATGKIRNFQIGISLIFLLELPIAYLLLFKGYKPYWAAMPSIVTQTIGVFFRFYMLKQQVASYDYRLFMYSVVFRSFLIVGVCFACMVYISRSFEVCLTTFVCTSLISLSLMSVAIFYCGLSCNERQYVLNYIRKIINKYK